MPGLSCDRLNLAIDFPDSKPIIWLVRESVSWAIQAKAPRDGIIDSQNLEVYHTLACGIFSS